MNKKSKNIIHCSFTSVWDDGSIVTTPCKYNVKTGFLDIEISHGPIPSGTLKEEFVTLPNGDEILVCNVCHEHVLKPSMQEGVGKQLYELAECSNPYCGDE